MTDSRKVTEDFSLENVDLVEFEEKGHSRTVDFTDWGCPFLQVWKCSMDKVMTQHDKIGLTKETQIFIIQTK